MPCSPPLHKTHCPLSAKGLNCGQGSHEHSLQWLTGSDLKQRTDYKTHCPLSAKRLQCGQGSRKHSLQWWPQTVNWLQDATTLYQQRGDTVVRAVTNTAYTGDLKQWIDYKMLQPSISKGATLWSGQSQTQLTLVTSNSKLTTRHAALYQQRGYTVEKLDTNTACNTSLGVIANRTEYKMLLPSIIKGAQLRKISHKHSLPHFPSGHFKERSITIPCLQRQSEGDLKAVNQLCIKKIYIYI